VGAFHSTPVDATSRACGRLAYRRRRLQTSDGYGIPRHLPHPYRPCRANMPTAFVKVKTRCPTNHTVIRARLLPAARGAPAHLPTAHTLHIPTTPPAYRAAATHTPRGLPIHRCCATLLCAIIISFSWCGYADVARFPHSPPPTYRLLLLSYLWFVAYARGGAAEPRILRTAALQPSGWAGRWTPPLHCGPYLLRGR